MAIYSGFSNKKIVIFHSYVKLPEGSYINNVIRIIILYKLYVQKYTHHIKETLYKLYNMFPLKACVDKTCIYVTHTES